MRHLLYSLAFISAVVSPAWAQSSLDVRGGEGPYGSQVLDVEQTIGAPDAAFNGRPLSENVAAPVNAAALNPEVAPMPAPIEAVRPTQKTPIPAVKPAAQPSPINDYVGGGAVVPVSEVSPVLPRVKPTTPQSNANKKQQIEAQVQKIVAEERAAVIASRNAIVEARKTNQSDAVVRKLETMLNQAERQYQFAVTNARIEARRTARESRFEAWDAKQRAKLEAQMRQDAK